MGPLEQPWYRSGTSCIVRCVQDTPRREFEGTIWASLEASLRSLRRLGAGRSQVQILSPRVKIPANGLLSGSVRTMLRVSIWAIAVLLLFGGGEWASAHRVAHVARFRCPPRHSEVLMRDRQAVVYEGLNAERLYEVFGCAYGAHRAYVFGRKAGFGAAGGGGVARERLAGAIVAYEESLVEESRDESSPGRGRFMLLVRDLRTGRLLHKVPTGPSSRPTEIGAGPAVAIVLKTDGAVAWISGADFGPSSLHEVRAIDKSGNRLLASGLEIDPRSLALKGNTLSWKQGGNLTSASLN
jgi:hypothetical protein